MPVLGKEPPVSYRLFVFGANPTQKGTIYLTKDSAQTIMDNFYSNGNVLTFNVEHEEIVGETPGHFKLALKDDGLWMEPIQWTQKWADKVTNGEIIYISPELIYNDDQEIIEVTRVALTNNPATQHLKPLALTKGKLMDDQVEMTTVHPYKQMLTGLQMALGCAQGALSSNQGLMDDDSKQTLTDGVKMMAEYSTRLMEGLEKLGIDDGEDESDESMASTTTPELMNQKTLSNSSVPTLRLITEPGNNDGSVGTILALSKNLELLEGKLKSAEQREVSLLVDLGIAQKKISPREKELYLSLNKFQVEAFLEKRIAFEEESTQKEKVVQMEGELQLSVPQQDLESLTQTFKKLGYIDGPLVARR